MDGYYIIKLPKERPRPLAPAQRAFPGSPVRRFDAVAQFAALHDHAATLTAAGISAAPS